MKKRLLITKTWIDDATIDIEEYLRDELQGMVNEKSCEILTEIDDLMINGDQSVGVPTGIMNLNLPTSIQYSVPEKPKHKPKKGHMAAKFGGRERWQK